MPTPEIVGIGYLNAGFPLPWSVQTWIPGTVTTPSGLMDSVVFAQDLAHLIASLRTVDTQGRHFSGTSRGGDLTDSEVCS